MYILITCCYCAVLKWEPDCWNGIKSSSHAIGVFRTQLKIQDEAFCENSSSKSYVLIIRLGSEYVSACKRKCHCLKCPNTEIFPVRIFPYSVRMWENTDQKKLRIWTCDTQWVRQVVNKTNKHPIKID